MKKRRIRYDRLLLVVLIFLMLVAALAFGLVKLGGLLFSHKDALKYSQGACVIYYPDNEYGLQLAKEICDNYQGEKKMVYDFELSPFGDYDLLSYPEGQHFLLNKDKSAIVIADYNDHLQKVILNALRYTAKKDYGDLAYNASFMEQTTLENFDKLDFVYHFEPEAMCLYFNDFGVDLRIDLACLQKDLGMNFALADKEYEFVRYVDPERKMVCLTFDDGPKAETSMVIIDTLAAYDGVGTFFTVGSRLGEKGLQVVEYGLSKGMVYGSHTYSHLYLTRTGLATAVEEVEVPMQMVEDKLAYQMHLYRPPYGSINDEVKNALSAYTAVLWNVDSRDWSNRLDRSLNEAVTMTKEKVISEADDKDVILFHDIYDVTVQTVRELVPYLIDEGYQLVSVDEMLKCLNLEGVLSFSGK